MHQSPFKLDYWILMNYNIKDRKREYMYDYQKNIGLFSVATLMFVFTIGYSLTSTNKKPQIPCGSSK